MGSTGRHVNVMICSKYTLKCAADLEVLLDRCCPGLLFVHQIQELQEPQQILVVNNKPAEMNLVPHT